MPDHLLPYQDAKMILPTVNNASLILANPDVFFGDVDGEVIALNMATGTYLHLNSSGSFIFNQLQNEGEQTFGALIETILKAYEVEETLCRKEVSEFVARCIEMDLLRSPAETS